MTVAHQAPALGVCQAGIKRSPARLPLSLEAVATAQASNTVDMTSPAALTAILSGAATSLSSSVSPGSVAVPGADQLNATTQLLGRVNALAIAASTVQVRWSVSRA